MKNFYENHWKHWKKIPQLYKQPKGIHLKTIQINNLYMHVQDIWTLLFQHNAELFNVMKKLKNIFIPTEVLILFQPLLLNEIFFKYFLNRNRTTNCMIFGFNSVQCWSQCNEEKLMFFIQISDKIVTKPCRYTYILEYIL